MTSVHEELEHRRSRDPQPTYEVTGLDVARIARASAHAVAAHGLQARELTTVPYAAHVLSVGALVLEHGGTTDQVVAALLHDVVALPDGRAQLAEVRATFGEDVARTITAVSVVPDGPDGPDRERRHWPELRNTGHQHLRRLVEIGDPAVLISACDRLDILTAIGVELDDPDVGTSVFSRVRGAHVTHMRWHHTTVVRTVADADDALVPRRLKDRLERALERVLEGIVQHETDRRAQSRLRPPTPRRDRPRRDRPGADEGGDAGAGGGAR
jgi:hypothetical protein